MGLSILILQQPFIVFVIDYSGFNITEKSKKCKRLTNIPHISILYICLKGK